MMMQVLLRKPIPASPRVPRSAELARQRSRALSGAGTRTGQRSGSGAPVAARQGRSPEKTESVGLMKQGCAAALARDGREDVRLDIKGAVGPVLRYPCPAFSPLVHSLPHGQHGALKTIAVQLFAQGLPTSAVCNSHWRSHCTAQSVLAVGTCFMSSLSSHTIMCHRQARPRRSPWLLRCMRTLGLHPVLRATYRRLRRDPMLRRCWRRAGALRTPRAGAARSLRSAPLRPRLAVRARAAGPTPRQGQGQGLPGGQVQGREGSGSR